ncbi:hypothetical protein [Dyadobacter pollutisoli]|uniref:Uncharacterized protein n=1 Tax=Dyadobacter pollutisoli TaxID=2910158 RepID=A0A9E8NJ23_9BACT|nr:hypothetical protein [Dyadobacter pollutisoli]WAC14934.1 hypothetical protein ON006_13405 [Dyadobacter pollutisoli]
MSELLEITDKDIAALEDGELRSLIGLLCEAEYRKYGIPTKAVQWGGHQDAPDRGIDILIASDVLLSVDSYIVRPHTIFQSKVTNMTPALILKEMKPLGKLRESIVDLAGDQGAYVIVSRHSLTSKEYNNRIVEMKKAIGGLDVKVDYYHGGRIATWVREHPSIILWIRHRVKRPIFGWKSYADWAANLTTNEDYILDDGCRLIDKRRKDVELTIENGILAIRQLLSQPGNYLRLTGLSGVGKTRLAQALFDERVGQEIVNQSHVIYTDISEEPTPSPQHITEQLIAGNYRTILIIDNCSPELHRSLVNKLTCQSHSVSLLTIEYDVADDQPDETDVFHLEPSSDRVISTLILRRFPKITELDAWKIAEFSGGNARVAVALAKTVTLGESIGYLQNKELFKRLFYQRNNENEDLKHSAEVLSLVYSYDVETASSELEILSLMSSIPVQALYKHSADLRDRDLVQARGKFRAVLPHAIANRLAIGALDRLTADMLDQYFLRKGTERLIRSFSRRLSYIPDSEPVKKIVEHWLAPENGWMRDVSNLNEFGMSIFENLASILPERALLAIERANALLPGKFASRENEYFSRFVRLLKHIGYEEPLFLRSAKIVAEFALTEKVGENSDSIRRELSAMYQLSMSGTYAPIEVRLKLVKSLWESNITSKRQLAIELIESALEAWHFQSPNNPSFGSRSRDYGLSLQHPDEVENWFTKVVEQCIRMLDDDTPFQAELKKILAEKLRGIWTQTNLFELVELVCEQMTRNGFWAQGWFEILSIVRYDSKDDETENKERLLVLEQSLRPKNLYEQIVAYFMSDAIGMDIADALLDEETSSFEKLYQIYEELGIELIRDEQVINKLLPTLFSVENSDILHLGRGIYYGAVDKGEVWDDLLNKYLTIPTQNRRPFLLKGWINSAQKENERYSDEILEQTLDSAELKHLFLSLQSAIPTSQNGVRLLRRALQDLEIKSKEFELLSYSLIYSNTSPKDLSDIIVGILNRPGGQEAAFEILYFKCHVVKSGSINDIRGELLDIGRRILLNMDLEKELKSTDSYKIGVVLQICFSGKEAFDSASEFTLKLMRLIRLRYGFLKSADGILKKLVKIQPVCLLNTLLEKGTLTVYAGWIDFRRNFEKYDTYISTLSDNFLLNWCREDPYERYKIIGGALISYERTVEPGKLKWKPIFWKLVDGAPNLLEVLDEIESTLRPSAVSGSRVNAYQARLTLFSELFDNPNIQLSEWARLKFSQWNEEIVQQRKFEEERYQDRNESFE